MSVSKQEGNQCLPNSAYALPGRRFLIQDRHHALAAMNKAAIQKHQGLLSQSDYEIVIRKSKEVLDQVEPLGCT